MELTNQVKSTVEGLTQAFAAKDINKYLSYYANNAVVVAPDMTNVSTVEQIKTLSLQFMQDFHAPLTTIKHVSIDATGNTALCNGYWTDENNNNSLFAMVLHKNTSNGNWEIIIENCFAI